MPKAKYIIINGQASDLQRVRGDYVPVGDEKTVEFSGEDLPDINTLHSLAYLRKRAKVQVKAYAKRLFEERYPDFKVLRHLEQKEAGITPTMEAADFVNIGLARQAIRNASNTIETEIDGSSKAQILALDIINHPAWPV